MDLEKTIESILFFKAEPIKIKKLADILGKTETETQEALGRLKEALAGRGVRLLEKDGTVTLGTAPEASALIEGLIKEELSKDLGKAGLETLAIVLYKGPVSRPEIDYIRGVRSNFILRSLMTRGLVERIGGEGDKRIFLYQPTFDLLAYLGIERKEDLPDYEKITAELKEIEEKTEETESKND